MIEGEILRLQCCCINMYQRIFLIVLLALACLSCALLVSCLLQRNNDVSKKNLFERRREAGQSRVK